jgi:hypothetical protein
MHSLLFNGGKQFRSFGREEIRGGRSRSMTGDVVRIQDVVDVVAHVDCNFAILEVEVHSQVRVIVATRHIDFLVVALEIVDEFISYFMRRGNDHQVVDVDDQGDGCFSISLGQDAFVISVCDISMRF